MKIEYKSINFRLDTLDLIEQANEIVKEYQALGFNLTLRQLFYQFVARGYLENTERNYKRVGSFVNDGRLAGLISWEAITDRTRSVRGRRRWANQEEIIDAAATAYHIDLWKGQKVRPEVWIEKDALVDVIAAPCEEMGVDYFSCRGYVSQSEMWAAAQRFRGYHENGQGVVVIHLGDHDPSGIDMSRDIQDRLDLFMADATIVIRIALTMKQVEEHSPPPNPAKIKDSRYAEYCRKYGEHSWELDALDPTMMAQLVEDVIRALVDEKKLLARLRVEKRERKLIKAVAADFRKKRESKSKKRGK